MGKQVKDIVKTAVFATAAFFTAGATAVFFASMALTSAMSALTPAPKSSGVGGERRTLTTRTPNATRKIIYGETRVGGNIVFLQSTNDDKYLHIVVVMAAHEINSFEAIFLNDEELTISGNAVTNPAKYTGLVNVYPVEVGGASNTPAALVSDTDWTANHTLTDQAYVYMRLEFDADAFPNGLPNISARVQGRKVYDPRSSQTNYSTNPALAIRDYLMDTTYGLGASASEINDTSFIAAANICDETVNLDGGGTEKRYEIDGVVDTKNTPRANIENMLTSLNGNLYYSNGQWSLNAGAYKTPTVTLNEDDFVSSMVVSTSNSARDNFNAVKGQFVSPESDFQPSDYPEVTSSTFENEDDGARKYIDLDLPFTSSSSRAQRIAKQILFKGRQEVTIDASFKLTAFQFEVGDTLLINNTRLGFTNKVFEVVSWKLNFQSEEVVVDCVLSETNAAVYAWDAEEAVFQQDNTTLPTGVSPPTPQNLTLTATAVLNDDGITIPALRADWDVVDTGFVLYYEVQFKRLGGEEDFGSITVSATDTENHGLITASHTEDEDYGLINEIILTPDAQYQSVIGTSNSFTITPVLNGYDYNVRVRSINTFGARSAFTSATLASSGDTTPPSVPTFLSAVGGYKQIEISWTNPADQDLDFVEIWENTSDNLGTASLIGTSGSTNFIRANLANNITRYYWVRAVDLSLNKSDFTDSVNATTLLLAPNDFNDAVNDLFQEAGAFGIEPVDSLPTTGLFDGRIVLLKSDITLYRYDSSSSAWSTQLFTASSVQAGSITQASFASGIEPVGIETNLPSASGYTGAKIVFVTSENKLYRYTGTAFTSLVSTQDLDGELGEGLFSDDLRPIERVSSLPTTGLTQGRVVLLTTDNKLYRYTGNEWTSNIAAVDVDGQISGNQIADDAITTTKITDDAITAPLIAANAVAADNIQSNAVTAAKITSGSISADKIASNAVTAAKLAADSITAGKIAAGAINASDLFVDGVIQSGAIGTGQIVANKIAASSIITSKIGTGAVTAAKISVSELSAISANLGTIQVGTANISNSAITSAKIGSAAVTNAKIGNLEVQRIKIATGAVSDVATGTYNSTVSLPSGVFTDTQVRVSFVLDANNVGRIVLFWQKEGHVDDDVAGQVWYGTSGNPFVNLVSDINASSPSDQIIPSIAVFDIPSSGSQRTITVGIKAKGTYRAGNNIRSGELDEQELTALVFQK